MTTKQVTLGKASDAYLHSLRGTPATRKAREEFLKPLREQFGDATPLADLDARDIARWAEERWEGNATGTQNIRVSAWRGAAAWWEKHDYVPAGYSDAAIAAWGRPKVRDERPTEPPTTAELRAILSTFTAEKLRWPSAVRDKALIMTLCMSGLRTGEALAIEPGAIDFAEHTIRLRTTKSGQAQVRGIHPLADDALQRWMDRRRELGINGHHPLFCTITEGRAGRWETRPGEPLKRQYVERVLKTSATAAGIERRIHLHGLRAYYAIMLQAEGVPLEVIQKLTGHSSLLSLTRYLAKISNAQAVAALTQVNLPDIDPARKAGQVEPVNLAEQVARLTKMVAELQQQKEIEPARPSVVVACPQCGRNVELGADGRIGRHHIPAERGRGVGPMCTATGTYPQQKEAGQ